MIKLKLISHLWERQSFPDFRIIKSINKPIHHPAQTFPHRKHSVFLFNLIWRKLDRLINPLFPFRWRGVLYNLADHVGCVRGLSDRNRPLSFTCCKREEYDYKVAKETEHLWLIDVPFCFFGVSWAGATKRERLPVSTGNRLWPTAVTVKEKNC